MKKDPSIFIGHMLDSIEIIEGYSEGMTVADLLGSVDLQDKIIRRIEINWRSGQEPSRRDQKKPPKIPWRDIPG